MHFIPLALPPVLHAACRNRLKLWHGTLGRLKLELELDEDVHVSVSLWTVWVQLGIDKCYCAHEEIQPVGQCALGSIIPILWPRVPIVGTLGH